ncbi:MAG: SDR family NAD(P)-dependent oxidoreductase [Rhodocyclaceae bacterium]|nr:SDR family NAD(P)-dependent oxidoreductase [Rhodocyclaceae bacterium]
MPRSRIQASGTPSEGSVPLQPIAIVGIAFRFPGDLSDEGSLWNALKSKRDMVGEIPPDRWAVSELQHDKRSEPGRSITFSAGVLSRIDEFDAQFFGISPREAAWLDPQQRLLLELAWEVMENAGVRPSAMAGSDCAVYVGVSSLDYGTRGLHDPATTAAHSMTGNALSIAANRISYVFDLRGPSLSVDTACSSSLVALHQACNSLRAGEASTALVGGVNILLHPQPFVGFTKASMLSAGGRCKVFDASGDGYVRAEGGALLLLKPLDRAIADGDEIHAVIRASGANADGARKTGMTIPSPEGQADLMRSVLARSGLLASEVDFFEAHGTGTAVGDPIEAAAIGTVYGRDRAEPLPIGSVKANLGHLEPASGMAGLVKAVLVLKNRAVPPLLHLNAPNPHIDFAELNLDPVAEYREFPAANGKLLVGGVNSFGFGGANAHVLLQEFRTAAQAAPARTTTRPPPLFLSARTDAALRALAGRYASELCDTTTEHFYDVAWAAAHQRDRLEKRLVLITETPAQAVALLADYAGGATPAGIVVEDALPENSGLAFVYSGNGAQWVGMGRRLLAAMPDFRAEIAKIDALVLPLTGFSILDELAADGNDARLDDTVVAQPLLFAIQVAVTRLLRDRGIVPAAVTGHSVGEVAAAWAAGALDLTQAVRVICTRSAAQGSTRGAGRMAAVGLSEAGARAAIAEIDASLDLAIAGINSPKSVTLSGALADLERLQVHLEPKGVFYRLLDLDYAFHSRYMDPIEDRLAHGLDGLVPGHSAKATFVSTVTGDVLDGEQLDATYWWRNVRAPVQFAAAVSKLAGLGCRVFVEIGPHAILQRYIADGLTAAGVKGKFLATLRKEADGPEQIEDAFLRATLLQSEPDLGMFFPYAARRVRLPNYSWQRERHWQPESSEHHAYISRRRVHPLLGWRLPELDPAWENTIDPVVLPWLADHKVGGAIVFPGSAYAEIALAAARELRPGDRHCVEQIDIVAPMLFDGEHARTLRVTVSPRDGSFQVRSRQRLSHDEWMLHAAGRILEASDRSPQAQIEAVPESAAELCADDHHRLTVMLGLDYGPAFRRQGSARHLAEHVEAKLDLPAEIMADQAYLIHPALLDVSFQSLVDFFQYEIEAGLAVVFLPVKIERIEICRHAVPTLCRAQIRRRSMRAVLADFELFDAAGALIARASGCRFRAAPIANREQAKVSTWRMVPSLRPHPARKLSTEFPPPKLLLAHLRSRMAATEDQRRTWFKETLPLFEALVLSFAYDAFPILAGKNLRDVSPYARWVASILLQEGLLVEQDGDWQLAARGSLPAAEEIWQSLLRDSPASLLQLALVGRVGRQLPKLLVGELDNREFHAALRRSPSAEALYEDDPAYVGTRSAVEHALRHFAATWPADRRLRVLEIAAGASGIPHCLLEILPEDRLDYVIALDDEDVVQRQRAEYQAWSNVAVAGLNLADCTLDADKPLPEVFDVIIVRHVLHRAANPKATLTRARHLLVAGGVLLLAERHPDWSADFLAGLDPAWWHETIPAEAGALTPPQSSLAASDAWRQVLLDEGFDAVECFAEPAADGLAEGAYLLHARRPLLDTHVLAPPEPASWLVLSDDATSRLSDRIRIRLESNAQRVAQARQIEDIDLAGIQHVVNLIGWGRPPTDAADLVSALLQDVQALAARPGKPPRLWLVTRGGAPGDNLVLNCRPDPVQAALWGFGRVVMNEHPVLECTLIDLACDPDGSETSARLECEFLRPDGASEILLGPVARYTLALRIAERTPAARDIDTPRFRLDFRMPGQLRNLLWLPETERPLHEDEVEVRTQAAGLNFRDVMYLMGLLPDEAVEKGYAGASIGLEFSGIVSRVGSRVLDLQPGDAVMGFGSSCFASHVVTRADAVVPIPENWTFEAAATVPTVFFTVYYALKHLADLQPGERVLIHGGAGGVGIAAIQLARHLGAEIFATAGSDEKRDFVQLLGADRVFDSRSLSFADDVLAATQGEGVDVILNSLAGEAVRRNFAILKPFGRFLELGKRDFYENTPIGLRPFKDNISYFGIDADQLLTSRPKLAGRLFRKVMALFRSGVLSPLPYRRFSANAVVDAFRVMQQARHIGKIVITLADACPEIMYPEPVPRTLRLQKNSTWIVTGGLAGFGLESAKWLAAHGVGNLVLLGRRGLETPGAKAAIDQIVATGATVTALACDITDADAIERLMERVTRTIPPIAGILHAAMVIDDRIIANLDAQSVAAVLRPKLLGAWNLHKATLGIPIEHFVLYSSITTALGNPGQANYVAANAALEGLAELRRSMGLPATCIGWGPIGDAGYLTRNTAVRDSLGQRLGKPPLTCEQAMVQFERVVANDEGTVGIANFEWGTLSRLLPSAGGVRFAALNRNLEGSGLSTCDADFHALIAGKQPEEIASIVQDLVVREVAQILCISADRIEPGRSLHELGLDSLMAVELALGLERRLGIQLPVMMLNESPTSEKISARITDMLLRGKEGTMANQDGALIESMARQHGIDVDAADVARVMEDARALGAHGVRLTA